MTMSFLGYSLLPMLILATLGILFPLSNGLGAVVGVIISGWSSWSCGGFIAVLVGREESIWLVFYPLLLFYLNFGLIIIFWVCINLFPSRFKLNYIKLHTIWEKMNPTATAGKYSSHLSNRKPLPTEKIPTKKCCLRSKIEPISHLYHPRFSKEIKDLGK